MHIQKPSAYKKYWKSYFVHSRKYKNEFKVHIYRSFQTVKYCLQELFRDQGYYRIWFHQLLPWTDIKKANVLWEWFLSHRVIIPFMILSAGGPKGCLDHRPHAPLANTATLLTLQQHWVNNQYRVANQT